MTFKPMLSPIESPRTYPNYFKELKFPLLLSPKLDGIRCIVKKDVVHDVSSDLTVSSSESKIGVCKSRKFIDLPNKYVQEYFSSYLDFDGEIIAGEPTAENVYNTTQSIVMSEDKFHEDIRFYVFDLADEDIKNFPFEARLGMLRDTVERINDPRIIVVKQSYCDNLEHLMAFEAECLLEGYEGVMLKSPNGRYKQGRGTWKEGLIYKLKQFTDDEGLVVGFIEGETNTNIKVRDNLGNAKRSTARDGMVAAGTLGKFIVDFKGQTIEVPCGKFSHKERKYIWEHQDEFINKYLKFLHFAVGVKDKPRFPRAIGWRDNIDM